jgi:hypothetical protein
MLTSVASAVFFEGAHVPQVQVDTKVLIPGLLKNSETIYFLCG